MLKNTLFTVLYFALVVFSLIQVVSAQNDNLREDLNRNFNHYDLIRLEPKAVFETIQKNGNFELQTAENKFSLQLKPRNLLAADYRAEETVAGGARRVLSAPALRTFKGEIAGQSDSRVRLSISENEVKGFIRRGGEYYFIEAAKHFSKSAAAGDFVLYKAGDVRGENKANCDLLSTVNAAAEKYLPQAASSSQLAQTVRVARIATEADFQFVTTMGGATQANAEILDIINMIEGVYENELNVTFTVTFQHVWTTQDPFPAADPNTVLLAFRDYWNANFPAGNYPRDLAHLFSDKPSLRGQGRAVNNAICLPENAYGVHGRIDFGLLKFVLAAHEIGHNFGATHPDGAPSCANTIMSSTLSDTTPLTFCQVSRTEISNYLAAGGSCLPRRLLTKTRFDFDGDDRSDISVFRPSAGSWYILNSGVNNFRGVGFGTGGDIPVAEDYDGDGKADIAVFRRGAWYILQSAGNTFRAVSFGNATDIPLPADFTGDKRAEVAVYRPDGGFWYTLNLVNGAFFGAQFGGSGDRPAPADYDGDDKADICVFRESSGGWFRINSSNNQFAAVYFGTNGDRPVPEDYDGDARADVAVFRPSAIPTMTSFFVLRSGDNGINSYSFGTATDIPVSADYDGDGRADIAVFRPSDGGWYRFNSSNGAFSGTQFGANSDVPVPAFK